MFLIMAWCAVIRLSATPGESPRPKPWPGRRPRVADNPAPPMKLLLIEDNLAMQTTLQRSFERRGLQVVLCGDGARALDRWRASVPDVVLLDLDRKSVV